DAGGYQLSPLGIRDSEHSHLAHCRVVENHCLDLAAIDILASRDDHVLQPVQYVEITIRVLVADIARAKEAVSKSSRRVFLVVPIPTHDVCPSRDEFATLPSL